jgi:hypothetical protein
MKGKKERKVKKEDNFDAAAKTAATFFMFTIVFLTLQEKQSRVLVSQNPLLFS